MVAKRRGEIDAAIRPAIAKYLDALLVVQDAADELKAIWGLLRDAGYVTNATLTDLDFTAADRGILSAGRTHNEGLRGYVRDRKKYWGIEK